MTRRALLSGILAAALLSGALLPAAAAPKPDEIVDALRREIRRAEDSLVAPDGTRPHYLAARYTVHRTAVFAAERGEPLAGSRRDFTDLVAEIRAGSPDMDDSRFEGTATEQFPFDAPLPRDGSPDLIRRSLWLLFDDGFRQAARTLAEKREWLKTRPRLRLDGPDFVAPEPRRIVDTLPPFSPDTAAIAARLAEISSFAREFPELVEAPVALQIVESRRYAVDNLGTVTISDSREFRALGAVLAQAEDGSPIWDWWKDASPVLEEIDLGHAKEILAARARDLVALRSAPPGEGYRGPVLFEGEAAAQLVWYALGEPLCRGEAEMQLGDYAPPRVLLTTLGHRLLPKGFSLLDLPGLSSFLGRTPPGRYRVDHEGSPARDLQPVRDGILAELPSGLAPLHGQERGNGHFRFGQAYPGTLLLTCSPERETRDVGAAYLQAVRDEGNAAGIVVERFEDADAAALFASPLADGIRSKLSVSSLNVTQLPAPTAMSAVAPDGTRTPARPLEFATMGISSFRDWNLCGADYALHSPGLNSAVAAPSLGIGFATLQPPAPQSLERLDWILEREP